MDNDDEQNIIRKKQKKYHSSFLECTDTDNDDCSTSNEID